MNKRIFLCPAHMSGNEMKFIQEAFDTNWAVPLGPNVNGSRMAWMVWMEGVLLRIPGNENNREALRELLPDRWAKLAN